MVDALDVALGGALGAAISQYLQARNGAQVIAPAPLALRLPVEPPFPTTTFGVPGRVPSGATVPASPTLWQFFLHTPAGRSVLLQWNGTTWLPLAAHGTYTIYVNPAGTDDVNHGFGTGADAYATVMYAWGQIPPEREHTAVVFVGPGTYNEDLWLSGKGRAGSSTPELYGVIFYGSYTTIASWVATGGTNGSAAGHTQINGAFAAGYRDGGATELQGKLVKFTSGANNGLYRIIGQCTATRLWLEGDPLPAAPQNLDTYDVLDWDTILNTPSNTSTVQDTCNVLFSGVSFRAAAVAGLCALAVYRTGVWLAQCQVRAHGQAHGLWIGATGLAMASDCSFDDLLGACSQGVIETEEGGAFEGKGCKMRHLAIGFFHQIGSSCRLYGGSEISGGTYGLFAQTSMIDSSTGGGVKTYVHGHANAGVQAIVGGTVYVSGNHTYGVNLDGTANANAANESAHAPSFSYIWA